MSDRYLCKAKRTDNGEWVKGYYFYMIHTDGRHAHHFIIPLGVDLSLGTPIEKIQIEVDPSTICQCTGLKDKNIKKIWENDIVRLHQFLFDGSEYEKEILISIEYITEMLCFGANLIEAKEIKRYMGYEDEDTEKVVIPFNDFYGLHDESFEVIGNIFDNPELLEGDMV